MKVLENLEHSGGIYKSWYWKCRLGESIF